MSKSILVSKREYKSLKEDKQRLDYMEKVVKQERIRLFGYDFKLPKLAPDMSLRQIIDMLKSSDKEF